MPARAKRPSQAPPSASPRDASATKERLLAAAEEEFSTHGFRGARVQAIVARAGVNERMLYHHFGDKEGLYKALFSHLGDTLGPEFEVALDAPGPPDPLERFTEMLRHYFDTIVLRPSLVRMVMYESLAGWPLLMDMRKNDERLTGKLAALFVEAKRAGVFRDDADLMTVLLAAGGAFYMIPIMRPRMEGYLHVSLDDPETLTALRERIIEIFLRGVVAR